MDLLVLNTNLEAVGIVDTYQSLIWTERYNTCGDFELYLPMDTRMLDLLQIDYYLTNKYSDRCMIIEDIKIESDVEEGNRLIITGRSLESILDRRIVWKQSIFDGNLQNAISTILNESIIEPEITERTISNFIFTESTDSKITDLTIEHQYTGDDVYSVIASLCIENNIGFKLLLTDEHKFELSLYSGVDRSYSQTTNPYVIFSPKFDNIINSNYLSSKSSFKNVTLVAGEGEGAARVMTAVGSGEGLDRRELFTDARDISSRTESGTLSRDAYISLLASRGEEKLKECKEIKAFEGSVDTFRLFVYGKDFNIGDIVQIADAYGNEGTVQITEVVISVDENGQSIFPTFTTYEKEEEIEQEIEQAEQEEVSE